jgi:hypothetical protein
MDFGEAYVGDIGARRLYDFTPVGDVVSSAIPALKERRPVAESCSQHGCRKALG